MSKVEVRRRPGGRSARVRDGVLDATLAILGEGGLERLTVADVAARAGVHETSIRRRWRTRESLICDALLNHSEQELPVPDTGSLREDLVAFASALAKYNETALGKALLRAIAAHSDDRALAEARSAFWRRREELASAMIERAIARGELSDSVDGRLALETLISPLHFRTLLTDEPLEKDLPRRVTDLVLNGIVGGRSRSQQ
jgi:AcrR family transcriptional regulator